MLCVLSLNKSIFLALKEQKPHKNQIYKSKQSILHSVNKLPICINVGPDPANAFGCLWSCTAILQQLVERCCRRLQIICEMLWAVLGWGGYRLHTCYEWLGAYCQQNRYSWSCSVRRRKTIMDSYHVQDNRASLRYCNALIAGVNAYYVLQACFGWHWTFNFRTKVPMLPAPMIMGVVEWCFGVSFQNLWYALFHVLTKFAKYIIIHSSGTLLRSLSSSSKHVGLKSDQLSFN